MVSQTPFPASDPAPTDPASDVDTDDLIEDVSIDGMCGVY
ncbi:MAG: mycofactocin precursor MftA, partial [Actinobacteria bacterium]|nr:mycofactocin precursor MftA [Actinomycetota bacterium]